jgi:hypothetical protein
VSKFFLAYIYKKGKARTVPGSKKKNKIIREGLIAIFFRQLKAKRASSGTEPPKGKLWHATEVGSHECVACPDARDGPGEGLCRNIQEHKGIAVTQPGWMDGLNRAWIERKEFMLVDFFDDLYKNVYYIPFRSGTERNS